MINQIIANIQQDLSQILTEDQMAQSSRIVKEQAKEYRHQQTKFILWIS